MKPHQLYNNVQGESSSDLSSDDDDIEGLDDEQTSDLGESSNTSLSQSLQSDHPYENQ